MKTRHRTFPGRARRISLLAALAIACGIIRIPAAHAQNMTANSPCTGVSIIAVTAFGASSSAPDNFNAFSQALLWVAKCNVANLHIPAGTYYLQPSQQNQLGLVLPSNINVYGDSAATTSLVVGTQNTGYAFTSLFWAIDVSNVGISNLTMVGNQVYGTEDPNNPDRAITIGIDQVADSFGTPQNIGGFNIANCVFRNFTGFGWIVVANNTGEPDPNPNDPPGLTPSYAINGITIQGNTFTSVPGDIPANTTIGYQASMVTMTGSLNSPTGIIQNVLITDNSMDASSIKNGVALFDGVSTATVSNNSIYGAGITGDVADDTGAYAINVYHHSYATGGLPPTDVTVSNNDIVEPSGL